MTASVPAFIGLDIETTGLDPKADLILEVGVVIFDDCMRPIAAQSWPVSQPQDHPAIQDLAQVVQDMHATSGLTAELRAGQGLRLDEVEDAAVEFIREHTSQPLPMLGSSITFDRSFLAEHMPDLLDQFHYRSIDATSLKLATMAWVKPPYREEIEADIKAETDRIRGLLIRWLKVTPEQRAAHRPIYDICSSAALAHACLNETADIGQQAGRQQQ